MGEIRRSPSCARRAGWHSFAVGISLLAACGCCNLPYSKKDYARPLPPGMLPLELVPDPNDYPDFERAFEADNSATIAALDESVRYFEKPSSESHFPYRVPDREITHAAQVDSLAVFRRLLLDSTSAEEFSAAIAEYFDVYRSVGWDGKSGEVLFTGYYTPIFEGRLAKDARYCYPLYTRPPDLVSELDGTPRGRRTPDGDVVPYYTRAEIENGGILRGSELVYLADPFEAYVVHVQGSARVTLEDGSEMHVGYAGKTDHQYQSVGEELIRRGAIPEDELSLARMKRHFREHPEDLEMLDVNECYVFFQESEPGPFGSIGARVTPIHTIATDKSVFPRGSIVVADAPIPAQAPDEEGTKRKLTRHVGIYFDQDTGGAIRSAGRADLYFGTGTEAEHRAGYTRSEGRLYYLFLKERWLEAE
ncbi:MAG: MltA domain-containing protein [Planctomycetes bacterium]|nr:MltA domain-containing protein [Planctomycetota bacterium]